jgi:hypothetical protein
MNVRLLAFACGIKNSWKDIISYSSLVFHVNEMSMRTGQDAKLYTVHGVGKETDPIFMAVISG